MKENAGEKPLYQKMEEKQKRRELKVERILNRKIQQRRPLFKPLAEGELEEYAQKVDGILEKQHALKREKREATLELQEKAARDLQEMQKGSHYFQVVDDMVNKRNEREVELKNKQEQQQKRKQYAQFIKKCYLPQID